MSGRWKNLWRAGTAGLLIAAAASQPAAAQLFINDPGFASGPLANDDPLVGLPVPGATANEYRAHMLWNLRAGLNVAALQCQFSRYLRAVDNYNALLSHHSGELAAAYTALSNYFRRVHGPREGPRRFDDYSTSTYNNFSTLQAQMGFCQTATNITKDALTRPKGELHQLATARMRELRNSLIPAPIHYAFAPVGLRNLALPSLADPCANLRGRNLRRCQAGRS